MVAEKLGSGPAHYMEIDGFGKEKLIYQCNFT